MQFPKNGRADGPAPTAAERKETHSLRSPPPDKRFLLDLLEGVLLQRSAAFYRLPSLAFALKNKVGRERRQMRNRQ